DGALGSLTQPDATVQRLSEVQGHDRLCHAATRTPSGTPRLPSITILSTTARDACRRQAGWHFGRINAKAATTMPTVRLVISTTKKLSPLVSELLFIAGAQGLEER